VEHGLILFLLFFIFLLLCHLLRDPDRETSRSLISCIESKGLTGHNVTICVVDDGLQIAHPDISPNYFAPGSWNFKDGINDPTSDGPHGDLSLSSLLLDLLDRSLL